MTVGKWVVLEETIGRGISKKVEELCVGQE